MTNPNAWQSLDFADSAPPVLELAHHYEATRLSVVIPAYDDLIGVLTALNSLQAFAAISNEYVLQDDASPSIFFPALIPPPMANVQRNAVNMGFAANCGAGAARAHGDVLLFLNQDVFGVSGWSDNWDVALMAAFDDPAVGVVGARLLFPDGTVQNAGGLIDGNYQPWHRCLGWSNPHHPDVSTPREVTWTTGAALAVRGDVWARVGGFDTAYGRGYFEDVDLCLRARELGYKVWYEPRATFVHRVGSSGGNPRFLQNAQLFKARWVDSGKVKPEVSFCHGRYW